VDEPTHDAPPHAGTGLLQVLARLCVPPLHAALQAENPDQSDQPPSTTQHCSLHAAGPVADPTQSAPPHDGAGLVQLLTCGCTPPPHAAEHSPAAAHADHWPSTTQHSSLHSCCSVGGPAQAAPPHAGAGLVHCLVLVSTPPPHSTEQAEYDQSVHPPAVGVTPIQVSKVQPSFTQTDPAPHTAQGQSRG